MLTRVDQTAFKVNLKGEAIKYLQNLLLPLSLVGMGKGPSPSLALSAESQKGFQQSLSCRRYAATPHIPSELPQEHSESKTIVEIFIVHIVFISLALSISAEKIL